MTDETTTVETSGIDGHKTFEIVVNGRSRTVETDEISYDELVRLGLDSVPSGPNVQILVSYRGSAGRPIDGSLAPGESVKICDGTVVVVSPADKS